MASPTASPGARLAGLLPSGGRAPRPSVSRSLPTLCLGGAWQMAIDAGLLLDACMAGSAARPVLRFYRWSRPTLSLGRHQQQLPTLWCELAATGALDLVRRPSGGGAVLHAGTLTYAVVWPQPPPRRQAYGVICSWLQAAFAALGQPLHFGAESARTRPASCFASGTAADLLHADGNKRIGSAQFWRGGVVLQHGTILLDPPAALWQQLFGAAPPPLAPLPLAGEALEKHLRVVACRQLPALAGAPLQERPPTAAEWARWGASLGCYRLEPERSGC